ncbi:MOSC N-terminal beta barrel domain-containing protein [Nocardioides sp.]|uniref:MOSC domain-containing protein n=1 Tax=Nocardioides sp. TaxID=35761 RepID=UPI00261F7013|nr:MOSC N-terminal beta barrel domain-containing protein [Nocardioides sp.]
MHLVALRRYPVKSMGGERLDAVEVDRRGLVGDRVNAVVATTEPFIEESWVEKALSRGPVALGVVSRAARCRMVDIAQDGFVPADRLLKRLGEERDLALGVYADVIRPGAIRVGDLVTLHD